MGRVFPVTRLTSSHLSSTFYLLFSVLSRPCVRIVASPNESVVVIKRAALEAMSPAAE
jgi:hypothetical protein